MIWRQALRFGLVGAIATLIHMVIGFLLIQAGWHPLVANIAAFFTAFVVSFVGHVGYSFADQQVSVARSFRRFALVGMVGFCFNETLLLVILKPGFLPASAALLVSTGCAAVLTFLLSRHWAFGDAAWLRGQRTAIRSTEPPPEFGR